MVSVLVVTYNQQNYIAQTLDAILAQQVDFPIEILVGEDCSTDQTRAIVEQYEKTHPNLRGIYPDHNLGVMRNYYGVIQQCRGKYIAECAGDDYWHSPDKLAKQVALLEEHPDIGLVHTECDYLFGNTRVQNSHVSDGIDVPSNNMFEELMRRHNDFVVASTVCFRRELYERYVDFDVYLEKGFMMEDWPMWLEFSIHTNFKYIPESLVTRRMEKDSVGHPADPIKLYRYLRSGFTVCEYFIDKYGCGKQVADDILIRYLRTFLFFAYKLRDRTIADFAQCRLREMGHPFSLQDRLSLAAVKNLMIFVLLKIFKKSGLFNRSYL